MARQRHRRLLQFVSRVVREDLLFSRCIRRNLPISRSVYPHSEPPSRRALVAAAVVAAASPPRVLPTSDCGSILYGGGGGGYHAEL